MVVVVVLFVHHNNKNFLFLLNLCPIFVASTTVRLRRRNRFQRQYRLVGWTKSTIRRCGISGRFPCSCYAYCSSKSTTKTTKSCQLFSNSPPLSVTIRISTQKLFWYQPDLTLQLAIRLLWVATKYRPHVLAT